MAESGTQIRRLTIAPGIAEGRDRVSVADAGPRRGPEARGADYSKGSLRLERSAPAWDARSTVHGRRAMRADCRRRRNHAPYAMFTLSSPGGQHTGRQKKVNGRASLREARRSVYRFHLLVAGRDPRLCSIPPRLLGQKRYAERLQSVTRQHPSRDAEQYRCNSRSRDFCAKRRKRRIAPVILGVVHSSYLLSFSTLSLGTR